MKKMIVASAFAVALASVGVLADVNYNPATGGFSGKGDVQTLFGLNNAKMQAVHESVVFEYDLTTTFSFECEWYTGPDHNRRHHTNTKTDTFGVNAIVASDSRKTGQWTGWFLSPIDLSSTTQPTDADCGAEGNEMKSIVDGSVEVLGTAGGLFASIGTDRRQLQ
jgi:hypothetical protein